MGPILAQFQQRELGLSRHALAPSFLARLDAQASRLGVTRQSVDQAVDRRAIERRTEEGEVRRTPSALETLISRVLSAEYTIQDQTPAVATPVCFQDGDGLRMLKRRAAEEGLPYQSLIVSICIIRQPLYATDQLTSPLLGQVFPRSYWLSPYTIQNPTLLTWQHIYRGGYLPTSAFP